MATADDESMDTTDDVLSEELVALEAIYIKELTVEYDEKNRPQSIAVMLHPATGMDESKQYVCMTLCFTFPPDYPEVIPDIMVKNPRGLGEENLQSLIEDMLKKAEERKGGQMLYELIEMAKDCLTEGNLPHCECAICLDHFEEGDNFFKTDCYHYYHRVCLGRCFSAYLASQAEEPEGAVLHRYKNGEQNLFRCPMCRVPLNYDPEDLLTPTPVEEKEEVVALPQEVIQQQQERAALYERQKAKGGIIDLEHEKNKFFVDENTVLLVNRTDNSTNDLPTEKRQPEPDNQQKEREPPALTRKEEGAKPSHRPTKQIYAAGRSRKNHQLDYADISQGYSDYEDDDDDTQVVVADRHSRSGGRGVRNDRSSARGSGGRGIRSDHGSERGSGRRGRNDVGSERGRGRGRKPREAQLSADQASRSNQTWRSDSDFMNSGQGYSEFVPYSAQSVDDARNDRTAARSGNSNYRGGHRGRGGRDHNRTYRREERDELRDPSDANFRRDRRNRKHDVVDSAENLREREKYNMDKRESSRNRDTEQGEGHSRPEKENEGDGRTDGVKNFRDGERDARVRDSYTKTDNRNDSWHDRTSPRDHSDRGHSRKDDTRGWYGQNTRNRQERNDAYQGRRDGRHQPEEDTERGGGYKEPTRPRGYHREKGDRDSPRDFEKPGHMHSPRDKEGYSRHQDFRDYPDNRFGNQRSDDGRHHTYQRKNENYAGSGKDGTRMANNEDRHDGRGGYKNRRHIADRQNSQETDDSEAAQEDRWSKPRVRGDRTFVRGQGNRGRPGGRGQNRTASTQWDTAQGPGRQQKTEDRGHNHFARGVRRPEHSHQYAEEDWGIDKHETVLSTAEPSSRKTGQSKKDDGNSDSRDRTSNKDGESVPEFHKPQASKGQRPGQKDGSGGDRSQKHHGGARDGDSGQSHAPPPGFSDPRPPPGFTEKSPRENHPLGADPPRPPAKVSPPPGFS